jgi:hypothetical protein
VLAAAERGGGGGIAELVEGEEGAVFAGWVAGDEHGALAVAHGVGAGPGVEGGELEDALGIGAAEQAGGRGAVVEEDQGARDGLLGARADELDEGAREGGEGEGAEVAELEDDALER